MGAPQEPTVVGPWRKGSGAADTVECWWMRAWGRESGGTGLGFQLGCLAAVLLWVCYLTSLSPH